MAGICPINLRRVPARMRPCKTLATSSARPPASQSQNMLDNNAFNYSNFQNIQNTQNAAFPGQFWRVTGQVQIGPSNRFDLDAATAAP